MFEWIWKKLEPSPKPQPPHIPIEVRIFSEFDGDLIACANWFVNNYKDGSISWGDLIMMQILLIERMNTLIASSTNKQD